ncbi:MAG: site-specific integrase [Desulfobaccales bacterium]
MKGARPNSLAFTLKGFLSEHLPRVRGTSPHTILSYRDALKFLLGFLCQAKGMPVSDLKLEDIGVTEVISFLDHLEHSRKNRVGTRNARLAAIHSFFRYVAGVRPECLEQCQRLLTIPFKRKGTRPVEYLEFEEIKEVIEAVDRSRAEGRRDYILLTLMFNTGARVQEVLDLKTDDLQLSRPFSVCIRGKGRKERICPIWPETAQLLREHTEGQGLDLREKVTVFTNRLGQPLTRFGVRYILTKYLQKAARLRPSLAGKRLHPHSMRHSTAIHLLKSGVDLSTIANWLGHASVNTTNKYASMDLEMKRRALEKAKPLTEENPEQGRWHKDPDILSWLASL